MYLKHKEYWVRERRDQRLRSSRTSSKSRTMPSRAVPWKSLPQCSTRRTLTTPLFKVVGRFRVGAYPARPNAAKEGTCVRFENERRNQSVSSLGGESEIMMQSPLLFFIQT